jgi:translation elongation factor EF-G
MWRPLVPHRIYQGTIKRGGWLFNMKNNTKVKVPRLVRMHSDEMEVYHAFRFPSLPFT